MMNSYLKIYDASAGSGKTFNLASNYIVVAMIGGFENILAVTFTNPAAKEMKDRIINVLHKISVGDKEEQTNNYKERIIEIYRQQTNEQLTEDSLKQKASTVLKQILHNYSAFHVYTIDSFFQIILKNLTKELGVGYYNLDLNSNKYDELAIDELLNIDKHDELSRQKLVYWLESFFIKNTQDSKSWNINKELLRFANKAFSSDDFIQVMTKDIKMLSIDYLKTQSIKLQNLIKTFETELTNKKNIFLKRCKELGLTVNDFKGKTKGSVYSIIEKKIPKNVTKDILNNKEYPQEVEFEVNQIISYLNDNFDTYYLYKLYYDSIYQLGVIAILYNIKSQILKEKDIFLLKNTAYLLNKLNQGDIEFVFEKISTKINNIFIDEFQDTNHNSFENLFKIMKEIFHNGGKSFIFGDIKQSIYRWNGGDFSIMQKLVEQHPKSIEPLYENFRSLGNIVRFNNDFFENIYKNYGLDFLPQKVTQQDNTGIIRIQFVEKKDTMFEFIKQEIDYYIEKHNYLYSDIAILFRSNDKLISIANKLKKDISKNYNPISDIAFKFSASQSVCKIIAALKYINNPSNVISKEIICKNKHTEQALLQIKSIYKHNKSLLELIIKISSELNLDEDTVFLPAFYDIVKDYLKTKNSNIDEFLIYWNETLAEKSVDISSKQAGVFLTSIHKSKGLEYKVVIIPYLDNAFYKAEDRWVISEHESLPIFLANSSKLENTIYNNVYEQEKYMQYIDNINLLYVAFTRSKQNLSIILSLPHKNSQKNSFNNLIYNYVTQQKAQDFSAITPNLFLYKNCESTYNTYSEKKQNITENIQIDKIIMYDNSVKFATTNYEDLEYYFNTDYLEFSQREIGSKFHSYLSKLITKDDKQNIILQCKMQDEDMMLLNNMFDTLILQTQHLHWFDGTYKTLNERTIINNDINIGFYMMRPDRVMYNDEQVIVVDYKFGKTQSQHIKQVKSYMSLIISMPAFKNHIITGYLWYIDVSNPNNSKLEQIFL